MFALAPAAQAASPTLAQITARLRTSAQYDDPAAKVTAAQKAAITKAINQARQKNRIVRVAILAVPPPDAPEVSHDDLEPDPDPEQDEIILWLMSNLKTVAEGAPALEFGYEFAGDRIQIVRDGARAQPEAG